MRVRVTSSFCLAVGRDVHKGEILDLPEPDAQRLIRMRYVVALPPVPHPTDPPAADVVDVSGEPAVNLDPPVQHHDPRPHAMATARKEK